MMFRLVLVCLLGCAGAAARGDEPTGAPAPLDAALRKLLADEGRWASTRTTRYFDKNGRLERTDVERHDPSRPPAEEWTLLQRDGRPPSAAEARSWRRAREREMRRRGRPLGAVMDFVRATVADETRAHLVYSVPLQPGVSRRLPAEKFYVLLQVDKTRGEIDRLAIRTTDAFRVAGVAQVDHAEADVRFGVIDPAHPAQPVTVTAAGAGRIVWLFRVGGRAEITWDQFERVEPYASRFRVTIGELKALDF